LKNFALDNPAELSKAIVWMWNVVEYENKRFSDLDILQFKIENPLKALTINSLRAPSAPPSNRGNDKPKGSSTGPRGSLNSSAQSSTHAKQVMSSLEVYSPSSPLPVIMMTSGRNSRHSRSGEQSRCMMIGKWLATGEKVIAKVDWLGSSDYLLNEANKLEAIRKSVDSKTAQQGIQQLMRYLTDEDAGVEMLITKFAGYRVDRVSSKTQLSNMARQLLTVLASVHAAGWMHSDLSVNNVCTDSFGDRLTLIDWEMAEKVSVETGETVREIHYRGTPGFISPELERLNGKDEGSKVSVKCDIYAAGCIIREIGGELVANSPEWSQLCNSLTSEDPNSRPTAAEALRNPPLARQQFALFRSYPTPEPDA
jgi:hypothetical protein